MTAKPRSSSERGQRGPVEGVDAVGQVHARCNGPRAAVCETGSALARVGAERPAVAVGVGDRDVARAVVLVDGLGDLGARGAGALVGPSILS